jgi:hypothetical protein
MILADISNKDAESFIDGAKEFIATIFNAVSDFLNFLPPIVLGGIVVILGIIFLYHRAKS